MNLPQRKRADLHKCADLLKSKIQEERRMQTFVVGIRLL